MSGIDSECGLERSVMANNFDICCRRIYQNYLNLGDYFNTRLKNSTQATAALKKFFLEQDAYMREMIEKYIPSNPYWRHVSYILAQYDGLVRGYGAVAPSEEVVFQFTLCLLGYFSCFFMSSTVQSGRIVQPVTCPATDASLTADPGVASSIPARSHTFVDIDHEIISKVILLPSAESFKKGCCQLQARVLLYARSTGYLLVQSFPGRKCG